MRLTTRLCHFEEITPSVMIARGVIGAEEAKKSGVEDAILTSLLRLDEAGEQPQ